MCAHVNEHLSVEQPEEHPNEHASLPTALPNGARRFLTGRALNRLVAAGPWSALAYRDFRLLWSGQLLSTTGSEMRFVAIGWQVYLLSRSPLQLGILGLLQAIPIMLFSLVSGVIADAVDRRKLLLFTEITLALCSTALALLTIFDLIGVPVIYLLVFVSSAAAAFDFPTRQALIAQMVPNQHLTNAYALNTLSFRLAILIGPTLGGFTIAWVGVAGAYWCDAASFLCVIAAILLMRVDGRPGTGGTRASLQSLVDGFDFLRRQPVLLGVMLLDFCAMLFAFTPGLLPIYAASIYHVGPQGLGILQAAAPVGAVLIALFFSGPIARLRRQGLGMVLSIAAYGGLVVLFGFASWSFALGLFFLAASGAAETVSTVLRSTIVQVNTSDAFRGRMSAVYALFGTGGPMLGQLEAGIFANAATAPIAMIGGGLLVILCAGISAVLVPSMRRFRSLPSSPAR